MIYSPKTGIFRTDEGITSGSNCTLSRQDIPGVEMPGKGGFVVGEKFGDTIDVYFSPGKPRHARRILTVRLY